MTKLVLLAVDAENIPQAIQKVWKNGNAVAPIDLRLPKTQQEQHIKTINPDLVIENDLEERTYPQQTLTQEETAPLEKNDALVLTTSGTAETPKAVIHTHQSLQASANLTNTALNATTTDRWLCCLPTAHIGGLSVILRAILGNIPLTIHPTFNPNDVTDAAKNGCTHVSLVTKALAAIDPSLFKQILLGGGPEPKTKPANATTTYGMTETASGVVYNGYPLPTVQVKEKNNELFIKSPTLFRTYRNRNTKNLFPDGWFPTGDAGSIHTSGRIRVHGKMGESIRTGGETVWPQKIEKLLVNLEEIRDIAIVGEPHPEWGNQIVAKIVPTNAEHPPTIQTLKQALENRLPKWYTPKRIDLCKQLPKTSLGKIKRQELSHIKH